MFCKAMFKMEMFQKTIFGRVMFQEMMARRGCSRNQGSPSRCLRSARESKKAMFVKDTFGEVMYMKERRGRRRDP